MDFQILTILMRRLKHYLWYTMYTPYSNNTLALTPFIIEHCATKKSSFKINIFNCSHSHTEILFFSIRILEKEYLQCDSFLVLEGRNAILVPNRTRSIIVTGHMHENNFLLIFTTFSNCELTFEN